ncbi:MAG TPA: D-2-hydroxyacid dehydrogenase [Ilumatobacteraceae bacterium]|nr:D-2-hydroxyacid dehydrogenase [Ilumatobacteraceae bacterium]
MPGTVLFCTDTFWDEAGDRLVATDPTVEIVRLVGEERVIPSDLDRITAACFSSDVYPHRMRTFLGVCSSAPQLGWLHTSFAGTDHPVFDAFLSRGVTVTNGIGVSAPSIAGTVMLYLLALSRDLPRWTREQDVRHWESRRFNDLAGMHLGIVGMGAIGSEVARLAAAFEMDVVGVRRHPRGDESCTTWSTGELPRLLGWADAIVLCAPLTDETRGMFDAAAFAAMRQGAWLINVGRGEVVDEPAMVDALARGHLGGAGLDVFTVEPLPHDSPLWSMPNVIITPHSSGITNRSYRRSIDLFIDNFGRYTHGEPLRNVVLR